MALQAYLFRGPEKFGVYFYFASSKLVASIFSLEKFRTITLKFTDRPIFARKQGVKAEVAFDAVDRKIGSMLRVVVFAKYESNLCI